MDSPTLSLRDLEAFDPRGSRQGREWRFCCPLSGPCAGKSVSKAHQSLTVNAETGAWRCWRCGGKGLLSEFRQERPAVSGREYRQAALRRAFALPSRRLDAQPAAQWREQLSGLQPLRDTPGAAYLERRGIDPEFAADAGTRFLADWFGRPAVIFPLRDGAGKLRGAQGRYIDGRDDPKTRTFPQGHDGAFYVAGALSADTVAIVEAPIDALSLVEGGVCAVLATCGTSWPSWLPRVCALRRLLLAHDADAAGDAASAKLAEVLAPLGARCERLRPLGAKDWNESLAAHGGEVLCDSLERAMAEGSRAEIETNAGGSLHARR